MNFLKTIFLLILSFTTLYNFGQNGNIIKTDSISLCILKFDYLTNQFEGGNLSYYEKCEYSDTIPFLVKIKYPGDIGWILFTINKTNDTIFYGSIVWMGKGRIKHPLLFTVDSPFQYGKTMVPRNPKTEYFDWYGTKRTDNTELIQKANNVWTIASSLDITEKFSRFPYQVGIYRYHPTDGFLDESKAKWIVFLFCNTATSTSKFKLELPEVQIQPNPCTDYIYVKSGSYFKYSIYDSYGKIVKCGDYEGQNIDIHELSDGIHYLSIKENNRVISRKIVIINNR